MIRERLDNWCEKAILVLVLAVLVFGPLATGAVRPLEFLILQGLTLATVLLWVLHFWLHPNPRLLWPPVCWAVVAFVIYAIFQYRRADLEYVARQEMIRILVYALLFFIVLNNLARQDFTQLLSCVVIFLGMAISMYAIYQFATDSQYVWRFVKPSGYHKRGSGTYICPNHLAGFLEMLAPVGLAYALTGRLPHLLRLFLGYASIVILTGIGVSVSRGGWVATGAVLAVFFALLIRRRRYRIPALIVVMALTAAGMYSYSKAVSVQKRFRNILSIDSPDTIHVRFILWKPTLQMWRDHFWLGVGPGHFDYRFPQYRPAQVQMRPGHAHNDYLNSLADWGVVGTGIVAAALGLVYQGAFRVWKILGRAQGDLGGKSSNRAAFVFGASLGLAALLIHSLTDFNMYIPANAILAVTLMALLASHLRFATERYWVVPGVAGRILLTLIGLAAVVYLGEQGLRRAREYFWFDQSAREQFYSARKVEALKRAYVAEPMNFDIAYDTGEALRGLSWKGDPGWEKLAAEATEWFQRAIRLNPFDPYNFMRIGMCLDWQGNHEAAAPYYQKALALDRNNYYLAGLQGWHYVQTGEYQKAKEWLERSRNLEPSKRNTIAVPYLEIVERKLKESNASPQGPAAAPESEPVRQPQKN